MAVLKLFIVMLILSQLLALHTKTHLQKRTKHDGINFNSLVEFGVGVFSKDPDPFSMICTLPQERTRTNICNSQGKCWSWCKDLYTLKNNFKDAQGYWCFMEAPECKDDSDCERIDQKRCGRNEKCINTCG